MSNQHERSDLEQLATSLQKLAPAAAAFNRDQLMFRAGRASARGRGWQWCSATAMLGLVAGVLATGVVMHSVQPSERIVYVQVKENVPDRPAPAPAPKQTPDAKPQAATAVVVHHNSTPSLQFGGYVGLRNQMIRWGADAMPSSRPSDMPPSQPPRSIGQMYEDFSESGLLFLDD